MAGHGICPIAWLESCHGSERRGNRAPPGDTHLAAAGRSSGGGEGPILSSEALRFAHATGTPTAVTRTLTGKDELLTIGLTLVMCLALVSVLPRRRPEPVVVRTRDHRR